MEKLIYLLERKAEFDHDRFTSALTDEIVPRMKAAAASNITINVADLDDKMDTPQTKSPRIFGEWHKISGAVHFWLDSLDNRGVIEEAFAEVSVHADGYLVTESIVQACTRTWSGKQRRPGVTQFALGRKPPSVTDEHFYHNWQVVHSPDSFELHPLRQSYVRNAIARPLNFDAPPWRFIVLEHWSDLNQFTDESLYYSSPEHRKHLWEHALEFLELDTYTGGPMSEYHFD